MTTTPRHHRVKGISVPVPSAWVAAVRARLERDGLSLRQLALAIGVSPSAVSLCLDAARPRPTSRVAPLIARHLDIPLPTAPTDDEMTEIAARLARMRVLWTQRYDEVVDLIRRIDDAISRSR